MIIYFSVENFLSIREKITLDFRATTDKTLEEYYCVNIEKPKMRILKMAMIYGTNASGKTNLLKAIDFLRDMVVTESRNKNKKIPVYPFAQDNTKHTIIEICFYHNFITYEYRLEISRKCIYKETLYHYPKGTKALVFSRQSLFDDQTVPNEYSYQFFWKGANLNKAQQKDLEVSVQNQLILNRISAINYNGPIQEAQNWFLDYMQSLVTPSSDLLTKTIEKFFKDNSNQAHFLIDQLQTADFNIQNINLDNDLEKTYIKEELAMLSPVFEDYIDNLYKFKVHFIHGNSIRDMYQIDYLSESLGTQRYFGFIALLYELVKEEHCILIDEIENSLHIDLLIHFLLTFLLNSRNSQLIFTSQNTELLNEREIIRRDAIWITSRKNDGSTELASVSEFPVRKEHAIDRLYRKGALGGIPNLGSPVMDTDNEKSKKD